MSNIIQNKHLIYAKRFACVLQNDFLLHRIDRERERFT